jgi:hypothetical protein
LSSPELNVAKLAAAHQSGATQEERTMLGMILIIFLILALVGAFPRWGHSREWGYFPTGGLGLVLLVVLILVILGRI